ncbi:coat protein [Piper chlorosis virus]|nr:coat protein [Piper chlorosis virus]WBG54323.1 coat protein [Piper chlorosis virus]
MPYTVTNPNQYQYFATAWAPPKQLIDLCVSAQGQHYQTQSARDTVREQFSNILQSVVAEDLRFPEAGFRVFTLSAVLKPLFEALMKSFDTKNRIIETEEESRPTSTEVVTATQRVDDATVAIRSHIQAIVTELQNGNGYFNRAQFEAIIAWVAPAAN